MKIKGKLALGFGVLVLITIFIAGFGIVNMNTNNTNVTLLQEHPITRYNNLALMNTEIMDLRRLVSVMAFRLGDMQTLAGLRNEALQIRAQIDNYLNANEANLLADMQIDQDRRSEAKADIAHLRHLVARYADEVIEGMFIAASEGIVGDPVSRNRVEMYFGAGATLYDEIAETFTRLMSAAQITMDNRYEEINVTTTSTMVAMIGLTIIGVIACVLIALLIANGITKPIRRVVAALSDVTDGNLNVNIDKSNISNDETGILTRDVLKLIDVLKAMVDDLIKLDHQYNTVGDIDYRIDSSIYQNSFKDMVDGVNNIPSNIVRDVLILLDALDEVNNGNFDLEIKDLPGKKMVLPNAVRATIKNLKGVNSEVEQMIHAAVNGDFSINIDESKYSGDWQKIMVGLNQVIHAVYVPMAEIEKTASVIYRRL